MTDAQRQKLFDALRGPIALDDPQVNSVLNDVALSDTIAVERVVDDIVQEERRGFFTLLLEICAARTR